MKIIDVRDGLDYDNFDYAVCTCLTTFEGIQIPRPDENKYIQFKCPRCNEELGMHLVGKKSRGLQGVSIGL